ncbi:BTB/POZ domain-containing protein 9, partial [Geodia barretti]
LHPAEVLELDITHIGRLASRLVKLFGRQLYTDVTFLVSGQPVGAHRAVLASQSDYFDCLLYGPMIEGRASEITLKETPVEAFRELVRFVYSGSVANVKDKCEVFMDLHAGEVIASTALQQLPKENLKKLIARDTFMVEEIQIFEAVRKWMETNGVRKEGASELLECVRLTEMPQAELKAKVLPTGLFARARVLAAMGEGEPVEIATRGRTSTSGDNINLFEGGDPRLTTCYNYILDLLPGRSEESATICDYSFSLTFSANVDPAHLTVRFDNVYLVNQIMFDGYLPDVCKSPGDADRDNSPFCYKMWVSRDGDLWTMVLDYSRLKCFSVQRLFFPKMAIRYVRILQSKGKENFKIHLQSCSYVGPVPYNFRDNGVIAPFIPMTPDYRQHLKFSENRCTARLMITFTQPYSINSIRVELEGVEGKADVSVSVATENRNKAYSEIALLKTADLA